MAKFIPVEPDKWAEMVKALAEVERLKAEVERLTFDPMTYLDDQGEWMPRHIHLAAVERLKAEVERLRKAGDEVCELPYLLETDPAVIAWRAAKEGKQP